MIRIAIHGSHCGGEAPLHALRQALVVMGVDAAVVSDQTDADLLLSRVVPDALGPGSGGWELATPPLPGKASHRLAPAIIDTLVACHSGECERGAVRDAWGVPLARADPSFESQVGQVPAGAAALEQVAQVLSAIWPRWRETAVPLWPHGAAYAIAVTHDVDMPYHYPPWNLHVARAAKHARDGAAVKAALALVAALRSGGMGLVGYGPATRHDDHFAFQSWQDVEAALGARSAFYVSVTPTSSALATPQDVTYDATDRNLRGALRRAVDSGWEVGLHASIRATRYPGRIGKECGILSEIAGAEICGVRHHFWCLPGDDPWLGWREHHRAGLRYDSSLGLNDAATFRWEWPWPFFPWDPTSRSPVPVLQIPPLVMDASVADPPSDRAAMASRLRTAAASAIMPRGVLVLDWHLEQFAARRMHGVGPVLLDYLRELRAGSDGWWATPSEIANWWIERDHSLWHDSLVHDPVSAGTAPAH